MKKNDEKKKHIQTDPVVCAFALLELLKEETDIEHSLSQEEILDKLRKEGKVDCSPKTLSKALSKLRMILNPAIYDGENKEDFKIIFSNYENTDVDDEGNMKNIRMTDLRYVHEFSFDEIDCMIEGVKFSRTMDSEKAEQLIEKIKKLTSRYYQNQTRQIQNVQEFSTVDKMTLKKNLAVIQQAIEDHVKISFYLNVYNREKELEKARETRYEVSPYYIAAYNGKYYLLANTEPYSNTSIYRIDLMTEVEIPERDIANKKKGKKRRNINQVKGMLEYWDPDDFFIKHMNMFYDSPSTIRLKVQNDRYTLIHDCFGERYTFKRKIDQTCDEIEVVCSPNAIVHWVMQNLDAVEVLRPKYVRDEVKENIEEAMKRYV